jgi:hypothetical protein
MVVDFVRRQSSFRRARSRRRGHTSVRTDGVAAPKVTDFAG